MIRMTTRFILSLFLSLSFLITNNAQQSPSIFVEKFDTSVSHRTNVCDRQFQVWRGDVDLPDALRGLNLTTVITNYRQADEDKYFTLVDGRVKETDPGLFAVVLDEVARRAGFEWRNSFGVASPLSSVDDAGKSWTDILTWGVQTFDISMEKWGMNVARMELGVSFPAGWWDSSIVLVELSGSSQEEEDAAVDVYLWSFLDPFLWTVWLTIGGTIVVTGILYWFLEYLDVDADERDLEDKPMSSIYYSALVFIGQLEFRPKTDAARIVTWSWTFWALIVVSSYTANMASFLVAPQVVTYKISTMEEAIRQNARICVQNGGVLSHILESKYGKLNLVPKDTEAGIFHGLRDDTCDVAAHQMNTFRIYEKNIDANPDCTLDSEKRVVQPVPAGMATAIDTGVEYCSSLISHVLDFHMTEMIADGFVERAWKTHLNKVATIECIPEPPRSASFGSDTFSLGMYDVGGIFILHGIVLTVALILSIFQFYYFNTSNKSMSEVFFVKQAAQEISRRRDSIIRASSNNNNNNKKHGGGDEEVSKSPRQQLRRRPNNNSNSTTGQQQQQEEEDRPGLLLDRRTSQDDTAKVSFRLSDIREDLSSLHFNEADDEDPTQEFGVPVSPPLPPPPFLNTTNSSSSSGGTTTAPVIGGVDSSSTTTTTNNSDSSQDPVVPSLGPMVEDGPEEKRGVEAIQDGITKEPNSSSETTAAAATVVDTGVLSSSPPTYANDIWAHDHDDDDNDNQEDPEKVEEEAAVPSSIIESSSYVNDDKDDNPKTDDADTTIPSLSPEEEDNSN